MMLDVSLTQSDATDDLENDFEMRRREPEQVPLFPSSELLVPDKLRILKKSVAAIHAVPHKPEHSQSLNNLRLFDACIVVAQIDCRTRGDGYIDRVRTERLSPMFEVRTSELARIAGIPGKNLVRIYKELDLLYDLTIRWNIIGEDKGVEWEMRSHFISSLGYGKGHKTGMVRFSLDPEALAIVLEPTCWATLSLQAKHGLGTPASYRLYEAAWRYFGTQHKVTALLPAHTWIELLIGPSRFVVEDPKLGKVVKDYGDFKRRHLDDAVARVNAVDALSHTIKLIERKSGNKVVKLQFQFVPKEQPQLGLPITWPPELVQVLGSMGFSARDVEDLSQGYSLESVMDALMRMKAAEARLWKTKKTITSKRSYFEGILRNISEGVDEEPDDAKLAEEARRMEALRAAEARQTKLKEEFEDFQRERFNEWLFALDAPLRHSLVKEYMENPDNPALLKKTFETELSPSNRSALTTLRQWLKAKPEMEEEFFPNPEDKNYEAWLAWKLDGGVRTT